MENKAAAKQAKAAAQESLGARQRILAEAGSTRKKRTKSARRLEQSRQLDRQREEIHPPHVLEKLAAMQPPPPQSRLLPKAEPDREGERPIQKLAIRERGQEV